ncbi:MAG TPA: lipid A biosynthesis lauroyl acyltransferase [Xanthobacteraceae bacterium]|jgi:KDO2-lipid IV(A) lauroyltransferase
MTTLRSFGRRVAFLAKSAFDQAAGTLLTLILKAVRHVDRIRVSNAFARVTRTFGPWLPEHRLGRANLTAAFPEKSPEEIERILTGVWDNLGRVVAEFAHLDRLTVGDPLNLPYVKYDAAAIERFNRIRDDGKAALVFAAHLANWELPAIIAAKFDLDALVLYRRPNVGAVADAVIALRQGSMGTLVPTDSNAPIRLARALEVNRHVAMLVDQHYGKGVDVTFFGRRCKANPLIAALARHVECPIYGTRIIRLPGGAFRGEISEQVPPVRDAEGRVDVAGTMQAITNVVEGWVREHPEQWLWLHRRWRE